MAFTDLYAFAPGWNVALGSLANIETALSSRNRDASGVLYPVRVLSPVIRHGTVASELESGRIRVDGKIPHWWEMVLYDTACDYLMGLFTAASVKWTIYSKQHDRGAWARYNVWAIRPGTVDEGDLVYRRNHLLTARIRFNDLHLST